MSDVLLMPGWPPAEAEPAFPPDLWILRESWRLRKGRYQEPVWANSVLWDSIGNSISRHFLHVCEKDPMLLSYTPNDTYGIADRKLNIRPGRYLQKYFKDQLSESQIKMLSEWQLSGQFSGLYADSKLHFADSPECIAWVYKHGPRSCMSILRHGVKRHPTRAYGAGDLQVAWLETPKHLFAQEAPDVIPPARRLRSRKPVLARALCWPERRIYSRIYPNHNNWHEDGFDNWADSMCAGMELGARLQALGYREDWHASQALRGPPSFTGARLLWLLDSRYERRFFMPFLDGGWQIVESQGSDGTPCWKMVAQGGYSGNLTGGYLGA